MKNRQSTSIAIISTISNVETDTHTHRYVQALSSLGYQCLTIMPGQLRRTAEALPVLHVPVPSPSALFWYDGGWRNTARAILQRIRVSISLFRRVLGRRPDIILCYEPDGWFIAVLTRVLLGSRVVVDLREVYDERALAFPGPLQGITRRGIRLVMKGLSRFTDQIIHVSLERQQLFDFLASPGIVVTPFPSLSDFPCAQGIEHNGRAGRNLVLVHGGALRSSYGSEQLLEAVDLARHEVPGLKLVVLGGVFGELGNPQLLQQLTEEGVLEIKDHMPFHEVVKELQASDVGISLVLPVDMAHRFAQPRKLYEYFAAGLPVIVADVPTLRRIVIENEVGEVVDPTSPVSIAEAIVMLGGDQERRYQYGKNARNAFETKYNWDVGLITLQETFAAIKRPIRIPNNNGKASST